MRITIVLLLAIASVILQACDSALIVRGTTLEDCDPQKPIQKAELTLYPHVEKGPFGEKSYPRIFYSDSLGNFDFTAVIGPGTYRAALVAAKEGFLTDTLYFNYEPLQPESLMVSLKRAR